MLDVEAWYRISSPVVDDDVRLDDRAIPFETVVVFSSLKTHGWLNHMTHLEGS